MSGFTVLFQRDGQPASPVLLRRMNDSIQHRGPDGSGYWVEGSVGLGHQMLHTTPEAVLESQPTVSSRGDLVLVYEGLIDNGEEIRRAARHKDLRVADKTDATAILLAYELWQEGCTERLCGDFAFVIWDRTRRQCFCARDPMGIRPFYYHLDDRLLVCGSELRQLLLHPDIRRDPNEGMAAEYLANAVTSTEETLYRDIQRLPAAHALRVSADRHLARRHWTFNPERRIRCRTDGEYAEALFTEISAAVRACGRAIGPLGIELSGGLDSSSVVAMARRLADRGHLSAQIQTLSVSYPGLDCDEGDYVREADRFWQTCTRRVPFALPSRDEFTASLRGHHEFPECPNGTAQYPLYRAAREQGCRVLLGGLGGDDCLTGHYLHYADMVKHLKISALLEQMHFDRSPEPDDRTSILRSVRAIWALGVRPLVPSSVRRGARRVLRRGHPDWISERFARAVGLPERVRRPRMARRRWQSRAQEALFEDLTNGWAYHVNETLSRVLAEHGLEQRSPLLRVNVVEFALGIPEEQRWRRAETKFVLRQAMKGLLPEKIRTRLTKADFGQLFPQALSRLESAPVFDSLHLASLGWLDSRRVSDMHFSLAAWRPGSSIGQVAIWPLWMIFGIECWFRNTSLGVEALPG